MIRVKQTALGVRSIQGTFLKCLCGNINMSDEFCRAGNLSTCKTCNRPLFVFVDPIPVNPNDEKKFSENDVITLNIGSGAKIPPIDTGRLYRFEIAQGKHDAMMGIIENATPNPFNPFDRCNGFIVHAILDLRIRFKVRQKI